MDTASIGILAGIVFIIGVVLAIVRYRKNKNNSELSVSEFISTFSENLLELARDCILLMNTSEYKDKTDEELISGISGEIVDILYDQCEKYDIDVSYLELFGKDTLKYGISTLITKYLVDIKNTIKDKEEIKEIVTENIMEKLEKDTKEEIND